MGKRAAWSPADWTEQLRNDDISVGLLRTNFCRRFADLMRAAMLVSAYKYGEVSEAYPERVNAIDSLKKRLEMYRKTGNTEYLVDVANFAMIEFMHPAHERAYFQSTDASGSPGRVMQNRDVYDKPTQFANKDIEPASA